jgi:glyoxylase-like metal-dependent hydrolase (beta-lactamase superfamily II)
MEVTTFALGPLQTNGYLLEHTGRALFIDPGGDPAPVLAALKKRHPVLEAVALTHLHFDHTHGAAALAAATGATVLANPADAYLLDSWLGRGGEMGAPLVPEYAYSPLLPGDTRFMGLECRVLATPGHSPGSLTLYFPSEGAAFVGDLIFQRSIGRSDFPGGDTDVLLAAVREKIFTLPGETRLYPGHGPATTVAAEAAHNPFFAGVL